MKGEWAARSRRTTKARPANRVATGTPAAPTDRWTVNASSAASKAALNGLPARISGAGATPGRRGRGCENTLAAMPHRALGEGVAPATAPVAGAPPRTRRRCRQDVAVPADKQESRCESPEGRSVNRPRSSFSHCSAAWWGGRGLVGTRSGPTIRRPADPASAGGDPSPLRRLPRPGFGGPGPRKLHRGHPRRPGPCLRDRWQGSFGGPLPGEGTVDAFIKLYESGDLVAEGGVRFCHAARRFRISEDARNYLDEYLWLVLPEEGN